MDGLLRFVVAFPQVKVCSIDWMLIMFEKWEMTVVTMLAELF
jgi:hypothetical protein